MFGPGMLHNPYCCLCLERSQICNQFAEVIVIALLELVFDDNSVAILILRHEVDAEGSSRLFSLNG